MRRIKVSCINPKTYEYDLTNFNTNGLINSEILDHLENLKEIRLPKYADLQLENILKLRSLKRVDLNYDSKN